MPSNVAMLRGGPTPAVALDMVAGECDNIDSVVVMCLMKDRTIAAVWSTMSMAKLCLLSKSLDTEVHQVLENSRDEPPGPTE